LDLGAEPPAKFAAMGADEEAPQQPIDGAGDKLETLSEASVPDLIDRLFTVCWVMRVMVSLPMLVLYALGSLAFLVWFMLRHYQVVLALLSAAYLALLAIYYAFSLQFKELRVWLKKMMHRVLVELPKNIVVELTEKTQAQVQAAHETAKHHLGKAHANVSAAADQVGEKLDQVQTLLDSLGDDLHHELHGHVSHLKGSLASVLQLHKEKTKEQLDQDAALPVSQM